MMKGLDDKRVWLGGGAVAALLIIAVGWFFFIGPERSSSSDLNAQAATTRAQNTVLQAKVKALQLKSRQMSKYVASLKAALSALPVDSGLPAFTRQLSAQGAAHGVSVVSVVVGGITPVADGAPAASAPAPDPAGTSAPAPTTPTATPTPAASVAPSTAAGGLYSVAVTVQSDGTLVHQLAFVKAIQTAGPRRALVNSVQVTPGAGAKGSSIDGASSFTTSITVFSAPQTPEQIAVLNRLLTGKIGS